MSTYPTSTYHIELELDNMSDSQLEDKVRELAYQMGIPMPPVLELKALTVRDGDEGAGGAQ